MQQKYPITVMVISLLILAVSAWPQEARYNHPELQWFTITTEHFEIHYHSGAERTARTVARIAETVYEPITRLYGFHKKKTFHFIIRDHDDYSNGAAYYYDDKVEVWATPMDFDLRGTHPWLLNVISHEFTHLISLDRAKRFGDRIPGLYLQYWGYEKETRPDVLRGFPNRIFSFPIAGSAVPPWFAEGVAQFQTPDQAYDFWDTHRDMILRMAVLQNKMLTYEEMSSFGHNSLGNEMVYNSGFAFVNYITKFYGNPSLQQILVRMKSPFRLTFDGALKSVLGRSAKKVFREWKNYLFDMYSQGVQEIKKNKVRGRIIGKKGFGNFYPVWSPVGKKVVYISNQGQDFLGLTSLVLYDFETNKTRIIKGGVQSSVAFSPDGTRIAYARKKQVNHTGSKYFDLFVYDFTTKKEKQLTRGARVRNPAWSKDGKSIVGVTGHDGTDNLVIYSMDLKQLQPITHFHNGEQIFHPCFSPDGNTIVFDISTRHGRDIAAIDSDGDHFRYLIRDAHDARTPVFHPGKPIIYFAWDKTGIFNIYQYNLTNRETKPLTNVVGGAFMPSFHPEYGLVYSLYTEDGYKIAYIKKLQSIQHTEYLAQNRLIRNQQVSPVTAFNVSEQNNPDSSNGSATHHEGNYSSRPYRSRYGAINFLPRAIIDYGTLKLGTYLYSSEMLEKYSIFGGFAMNRDWDMDIFGIIEYNHYFPTFFLEVYNEVQHATEGEDKFRFNLLEADLGLRMPLFNTNNLAQAMFVYSRYDGRIETRYKTQEIKFGYTYMIGRKMAFIWRHISTRQAMDRAINPSGGRKIEFRYDWQHNKFIDGFKINAKYGTLVETYTPYTYNQIQLRWEEYVSLPWRHTVTFKLNSGYIDRKIDSFFNFFAGGILGIKGYPYYSIEGRKLLSTALVYRFRLSNDLGFHLAPMKFDKLFAAVFFEAGNAWDKGKPYWKNFKRDVGVQLRMETFMFYNFPTRFFLDAAYGLDRFLNRNQSYGREWRFYVGVAFDYID